jgi:hypothetical protein
MTDSTSPLRHAAVRHAAGCRSAGRRSSWGGRGSPWAAGTQQQGSPSMSCCLTTR